MEKKIHYFVNYNGLYFGCDYAESYFYNGKRILSFYKNVGSESGVLLCSIELSKCIFRFTFKNDPTGIYYFEIVPVDNILVKG